ncbi:MAG: ABC transporter ATP-binding protein [Candidatus Bathyarchaeota archaeon]|nr:ABC transporter ATP-binding protein [Candidatus Bathyarchaeota archaeon]
MKENIIIEVEGLVKHYGEVKALDDISFSVKEGEIFGLLGPNGAGKTTLMEILCGLRKFDKGKVTVQGFDLVSDSYKIRSLIGFCPQETLFYDLLSVRENFAFSASLYSLDSKKFRERIEFLSKFLGIGELMNRKAQQLSGGMKRHANLATSIVHNPPIVILDEPAVGFDPNVKREFWELIKNLKGYGKRCFFPLMTCMKLTKSAMKLQ